MAKRISCLTGAMLISALPALSQDDATEALRKEIQAMRQEYEARIQKLESRIEELEEKPAPAAASPAPRRAAAEQPPTPQEQEAPAVANEAREWRRQADKQFEGDTETRDIARRPDAETALDARIEQVLEGYLDITGYFRAGYGRSDAGGPQRAFGIPGVAKYRLGNEAENYGELAFAKTFFPAGLLGPNSDTTHDPVARLNLRLAFYNPYDNYGSSADTDFSVPELWSSIANVIPGMPEAKFWAGSRFYRRHDIHINDFYFWDMSGGGAGIEDVPLGSGKFAFAWIGDGAESAIYSDIATSDPLNVAGFSKSNFDFRWYDWPFFGGKGELGFVYSMADSGVDSTGVQADDSDGFSVSLVRTREDFLDMESLHKTSLQVGTGPAKTFSTGFENFTGPAGTFIRPDPEESWRARATDQWVIKPFECFSIGSALVYQYTEFGDNAPYQHWASAGVRPIWHFNEHFSLALEPGVDWVSGTAGGHSGTLGKITLAPQVSLGDEFFSRPVLRAFVTYAMWANGLEGGVGGADYARDTEGWSWGVQMESWW
ncbi:carbohydrate porin [Luteolibacter arcticus]|uniref:Carbohydrate porin n=1 Tax=Luteolibacter arcticus TaxID=1581411 RepID=A0ABT3GEJ1_9BACT|nr:carbohydrate porin [Luteolibacter arcticus]MCW1922037.1 carbohydrate porin [Luteolibacter arcticus]